jgi:hypothetical protein
MMLRKKSSENKKQTQNNKQRTNAEEEVANVAFSCGIRNLIFPADQTELFINHAK